MDPITFKNIQPRDLTIWYVDDKKHDLDIYSRWLGEHVPEEVNFKLSKHPVQLQQQLHEAIEAGALTKYNFFATDGAMEFEDTQWEGKPEATEVQDNYHGTLDVIKDASPALLGNNGHYFSCVVSGPFQDRPVQGATVEPDDYPLDSPAPNFVDYGDFHSGGPAKGIPTIKKDPETATYGTLRQLQHFDRMIGLLSV